jgi:cytochrome c-type biogenesis protein CcmH/NrfG
LIAGGAMMALALLIALVFSGKNSPRPAPEAPPPVVNQRPDSPPPPLERPRPQLPPPANDKDAEDAIRRAREHAKANPEDLSGQLALYDVAVRAAALTGHAAAVARAREAVQTRLKALV